MEWNTEDGEIEVSAQKTVVEEVEDPLSELSLEEAQELAGDEIEIGDMLLLPLNREDMGRIAAQTRSKYLFKKIAKLPAKRFTTSISIVKASL